MCETKSLKPALKEDPVWTILPSYSMYESTFYGQLSPPQYEESTTCSESVSLSHHSTSTNPTSVSVGAHDSVPSSSTNLTEPSLIVADENTCSWRETILDNIHNLRNFTDSDNAVSNQISISIHFTEDVGEPGKVPKHIDPLIFEYKQGDYLNGYILLENKSDGPINFEMFYVLFEGNFEVLNPDNTKSILKIKKFLEMYDFAASWNWTSVDRLLSDENEHFVCNSKIDPLDNTKLCIRHKQFVPGVKYKRFFTFKIPEKLLDTECNEHNLAGHTELPPTVGVSLKERNLNITKMAPVTDFSFVGASTSYAVIARFIGRASQINEIEAENLKTKLINSTGDEFVIIKENVSFIRILQDLNCPSEAQKEVTRETSRILYENFQKRVEEKIRQGSLLKQAIANGDDVRTIDISARMAEEDALSGTTDAVKARQLYTRYDEATKQILVKKSKDVSLMVPIYKKSVFGSEKMQGTITVSTPRTDYLLNYMQPECFRSDAASNEELWKLQIPIEVTYSPCVTGVAKAPEIRGITSELVVFTLKSDKRPIPVELNHGFLFKNVIQDTKSMRLTDDFDHIVKMPMQQYSKKLISLMSDLGLENFKVEKSLAEDLIAMASVETKYNNLSLRQTKIVDRDGETKDVEDGLKLGLERNKDGNFSNEFKLLIDARKAQKKEFPRKDLAENYKSFNEFCLVPSFQTCLFSRMYYIKIFIHLSTSDIIELKLPVTIAKMPVT